MSNIRLLFHRLSASFHARRAEAELGREIDAHLRLLEEKFVAEGMSPEEAPVSRRTREIGVRVALGAPASRVIADVFRRPLLQVATGVVVGCGLLAVVAFPRSGSGVAMARQAVLLLAYGIAVMGVCVLACIGPALRALRVDPVEALKQDA